MKSLKDKTQNIRFSFRVVTSDDKDWPYNIERKGWFFWTQVGRCRNENSAKEEVMQLAAHEYRRSQTVIFEYTHEDFLADKLRR